MASVAPHPSVRSVLVDIILKKQQLRNAVRRVFFSFFPKKKIRVSFYRLKKKGAGNQAKYYLKIFLIFLNNIFSITPLFEKKNKRKKKTKNRSSLFEPNYRGA
jgi:hypothetical protein